MEFDFTCGFTHLRSLDWTKGHCYLIPTFVVSWDDTPEHRSTSFSIKWLFIQFGCTFTEIF